MSLHISMIGGRLEQLCILQKLACTVLHCCRFYSHHNHQQRCDFKFVAGKFQPKVQPKVQSVFGGILDLIGRAGAGRGGGRGQQDNLVSKAVQTPVNRSGSTRLQNSEPRISAELRRALQQQQALIKRKKRIRHQKHKKPRLSRKEKNRRRRKKRPMMTATSKS